MKLILPGLLLAAVSVLAQQPQRAPQSPLKFPNVPPETIVATVNGTKLTAGELKATLESMDPSIQGEYMRDPRAFLQQFALLDVVTRYAEKEKLDQKEPYRSRLKIVRSQILVTAATDAYGATIKVTPEDQKKFYDSNLDRYTQAKIKAIYIPFQTAGSTASTGKDKPLTEAEAAAKAADVVKQARAGTDFVKLVKENSKDAASVAKGGDMGTLRKSDNGLAPSIKNAIFSRKAGEVTDALKLANGFYIIRVEEIGPQAYDTVKNDIYMEIRNKGLRDWVDSLTKETQVKVESEDFFRPPAPPPSLAHPAGK